LWQTDDVKDGQATCRVNFDIDPRRGQAELRAARDASYLP
jgi:hypothetical protein